MGMVAVAALAASAPAVGVVNISATCRRTRSAAIAGSRSYLPFSPAVLDPEVLVLEEAGVAQALTERRERIRTAAGEKPLSNPITGIAGCCARAASGHAAAAPPSSVMKFAPLSFDHLVGAGEQ